MPNSILPPEDPIEQNHGNSKSGRSSTAVRLVELGKKHYDFGIDYNDKPYAVMKGEHVAIPLKGSKRSLRQEISGHYYEEREAIASENALTEAMGVFEHEAHKSGVRSKLYLRAARIGDQLFIDMGDREERVIHVTRDGWTILDRTADIPVIFRRTSVTKELPTPTPGGRLDRIWDFVNIDAESDRLVITGWLLGATLLVDSPCPILALMGEQGSAKTSAARRLFSLFDPSMAPVRRPPKDADRLLHAGANSRSVTFDNLSSIPRWLSDALCRYVTGESDVDRTLYTDDDVRIIQVQGVLGFTAIDVGALAGDLAERCVWGNLSVIPSNKRRSERELEAAWNEAYPEIVGGLLDLVSQVLRHLPMVDLTEKPRMADFAEVLAAMDLALDTNSLEHYIRAQESVAEEIVDTDAFLMALTANITTRWTGTGKKLYALLPRPEHVKYWPEPRGITGKLRRVAPDLRKAGWVVDEHEAPPKSKRGKTWTLIPPEKKELTDEDLLLPALTYEMFLEDGAAWRSRVLTDGATQECAAEHVRSLRADRWLICQVQACMLQDDPVYSKFAARSRALEKRLVEEVRQVRLDFREFLDELTKRELMTSRSTP